MNYWDVLMETDDNAARYMETYGEGPGCDTRNTVSSFINDGESVLDVGSGPGWNMDHFQEFGPQIKKYKGTDLSPRFVRVSNNRRWDNKDRFPSEIYLPFELQDCRELKEPRESWDVVLLQDVLEHTNGFEKPVKEALRVARKRVIISFWHMKEDTTNQINDDRDKGEDGFGAWYNKQDWEKFLNTLNYPWMDTESLPDANRQHLFYIIEKEAGLDA